MKKKLEDQTEVKCNQINHNNSEDKYDEVVLEDKMVTKEEEGDDGDDDEEIKDKQVEKDENKGNNEENKYDGEEVIEIDVNFVTKDNKTTMVITKTK